MPVTAAALFCVGAAAIGLPAARALGASMGGLRVDRVVGALGLLALALVALRLVDVPIAEIHAEPGDRADSGRGAGLLAALLGAGAIAACGLERIRTGYRSSS